MNAAAARAIPAHELVAAITNNTAGEPVAAREVIIQRVFDAPARLLFLAYSKPEHLKRWFGPKTWPLTHCEVDFRVGGLFRFGMTGPDGTQTPRFGGEYLEIIPNEKIVYDNGMIADDAVRDAGRAPPEQRMLLTITFVEQAGKTTLTIHTIFGSIAMFNEHTGRGYVGGVNSGLDQLVDVIAALAQKAV